MSKIPTSQSKVDPVNYTDLKAGIATLLLEGRKNAARQVNQILVNTYWQIGKYIFEFEQNGEDRAAYGDGLINKLSEDLSLEFGKGFSRTNLKNFRSFYSVFSISQTPSDLLGIGQTTSDLFTSTSWVADKLSWST
jgi:hypothetical protein